MQHILVYPLDTHWRSPSPPTGESSSRFSWHRIHFDQRDPPPFSPHSRRAFSIPSLRSGAIPGGHLWYQSTEAFPRNWFLRNVKQAGSYAAPDFVYLFSVVVNSRYSAGGGIKAYGSAELIKSVDLLLRNFLAFFQASVRIGIRVRWHPPLLQKRDPIALATRSFTDASGWVENRLRMHREIAALAFSLSPYVGRYNLALTAVPR